MKQFLTPNTPPSGGVFYMHLRLPFSVEFRQLLKGALFELTQEQNWEQFGDMTPDEAAEYWSTIVATITDVPVVPVGTLLMGYWAFQQDNWLHCNGAILQQEDWPELMAVYPDELKNIVDPGDFMTPNLVGRFPLGRGIADFTHIYGYGDYGGEYQHFMGENELVPHTHGESIAVPTIINGGLEAPASAATASTGTTGVTGQGEPFDIMPPYYVTQYWLVGRLLP